jgi:prolipoprotein diacylglyceryltransferase
MIPRMSIPSISSIPIGPFMIHLYALFILTDIVAVLWVTSRRLTRPATGGDGPN